MARVVGRVVGRRRFVLDWRTRMGHHVAVRRLELLRVALRPKGWRCVGLYDKPEFRFPVPLLWVYASGAADDVGAVVRVRALPGESWGYFEVGDGREGFVWPCGDVKEAANALDLLLKHRLFPEAAGGATLIDLWACWIGGTTRTYSYTVTPSGRSDRCPRLPEGGSRY